MSLKIVKKKQEQSIGQKYKHINKPYTIQLIKRYTRSRNPAWIVMVDETSEMILHDTLIDKYYDIIKSQKRTIDKLKALSWEL